MTIAGMSGMLLNLNTHSPTERWLYQQETKTATIYQNMTLSDLSVWGEV